MWIHTNIKIKLSAIVNSLYAAPSSSKGLPPHSAWIHSKAPGCNHLGHKKCASKGSNSTRSDVGTQ